MGVWMHVLRLNGENRKMTMTDLLGFSCARIAWSGELMVGSLFL